MIADHATASGVRKGTVLLRGEDSRLAMANDAQKEIVLQKAVDSRPAMAIVAPREIVRAMMDDVPKGTGLGMANADPKRIAPATVIANQNHARKDVRRAAKGMRNLATRRSPRSIHRDSLDGTRLLKRPGVRQRTPGRLVWAQDGGMLTRAVTERTAPSRLKACHAFDQQTTFTSPARQRLVGGAGRDRAAGAGSVFLLRVDGF